MRLAKKYLNQGKEKKREVTLVDDFIRNEEDPMLGWVVDQLSQEM